MTFDCEPLLPKYLKHHLDGLRLEWRQENIDGTEHLVLAVVEVRDGLFFKEHYSWSVPAGKEHEATLSRLECLLSAMCYYFNTGGSFDEFDMANLAFHDFIGAVHIPAPGPLVDIDHSSTRTAYFKLENEENRYLVVADGSFTEKLTGEQLHESLRREFDCAEEEARKPLADDEEDDGCAEAGGADSEEAEEQDTVGVRETE